MTVLKYFQYVYLVFAIYFIYDAITKFMQDDQNYLLSAFFAIAAIGMFFFRRNFANKQKNKI